MYAIITNTLCLLLLVRLYGLTVGFEYAYDEIPESTTIEIEEITVTETSSSSETGTTPKIDEDEETRRVAAARNCACGVTKQGHDTYVIGGQPAGDGEFPWFAAITKFQHNKKPRWKVVCGASLINKEYAITAAHCLHNRYKDTLEVVFNIKDVHNIEKDRNTIRRKIKKFVIHPLYNTTTQHDDIALIQFKVPIDFQKEKVVPICLPKLSTSKYASKHGIFVGFGHTNYGSGSDKPKENSRILMKVNVPILSNYDCLKTKVPTKKNITESMVCAGSQGKDACINDSGGPLMVQENSKTTLVGLASWGIGCGLAGYPGVYTRVSQYLEWITTSSANSLCA
ncbi:Enteropeptidase [Orchesella cincta]|uniref:limulus clotting factor C n=1 Tax=Orchesella cincta TaxID=48709 RepID=A0A1D2NMR7_ORCCI|nr:Enteropeptidase [Orchesella cincta]